MQKIRNKAVDDFYNLESADVEIEDEIVKNISNSPEEEEPQPQEIREWQIPEIQPVRKV